ncbi:MAG: hypothetical protein QM763_21515 [Agriterribacter sp.]
MPATDADIALNIASLKDWTPLQEEWTGIVLLYHEANNCSRKTSGE